MKLKIRPDRTPILESLTFPKPVRCPKAIEAEARAIDRETIQTLVPGFTDSEGDR
jgi:hypothetical protein